MNAAQAKALADLANEVAWATERLKKTEKAFQAALAAGADSEDVWGLISDDAFVGAVRPFVETVEATA